MCPYNNQCLKADARKNRNKLRTLTGSSCESLSTFGGGDDLPGSDFPEQ